MLYACTSLRDLTYWDTGEMDYVPYTLGIAHPPGFPLYMVLGFAWSHAVAVGSVALRMSWLSSFAMAVAALGVMRAARGRFMAGIFFGLGGVVWADATRAEVHAVFAAFAIWWLAFALDYHRVGARRSLLAAAACLGAAAAVHPLAFCLLPALLALMVARVHDMRRGDIALAALVAVACAALPFLYFPAADAAFRTPSYWADYLGVVNAGVTYSGMTAARAIYILCAFQGLYLVPLLACFGGVLLWRRDTAAAIAVATFGLFPALAGTHFEEADPNRYFLCAAAAMSMFAAEALVRTPRVLHVITIAGACAAAVIGALQLPHFAAQTADVRARRETDAIVAATPDTAVIVTSWTLTPPLRYRERIEHSLGHRTIVSAWWGDVAGDVGAWLKTRSVYVSGTPEGVVPGYQLRPVSQQTELYRVVAKP